MLVYYQVCGKQKDVSCIKILMAHWYIINQSNYTILLQTTVRPALKGTYITNHCL
jgi:hypothetical protein